MTRGNRIIVTPGDRYGRLVIVSEAQQNGFVRRIKCRCECGETKVIALRSLRSGDTKSCGCLTREQAAVNGRRNSTHGHSSSPTYMAWLRIRRRCNSPRDADYVYYGERGISVCERWGDFEAFLKDMGERPSNQHSIDRIDVNGNYEPGNCRWATRAEQSRNTRRTVMLTLHGRTMCLEDWAQETGISRGTINSRIELGFTVEEALTLPTRAATRNAEGQYESIRNSR